MKREEQLKYCTICQLRNFNPKHGIICSLTGEPASFQVACPDFIQDEKASISEKEAEQERQLDIRKTINYGRYNLLLIGTVFLALGLVEIFVVNDYSPFNTLSFLTLSVTNFTLALWSYEKPVKANIAGLTLFIAILLTEFIIDPVQLLDGFVIGGYFSVICAFIAAITVSISQKKVEKD